MFPLQNLANRELILMLDGCTVCLITAIYTILHAATRPFYSGIFYTNLAICSIDVVDSSVNCIALVGGLSRLWHIKVLDLYKLRGYAYVNGEQLITPSTQMSNFYLYPIIIQKMSPFVNIPYLIHRKTSEKM